MLSSEDRLDERTMQAILISGHSRIPVYREGNRHVQKCTLGSSQLSVYRHVQQCTLVVVNNSVQRGKQARSAAMYTR
jgi:hypothetical protein